MANEGEYPKVDGDVLYASEVNSFIRNKAKGLTPTTDLAPAITDLTNITDEDATTACSLFSITGQTAKEIKIDLGALYYVINVGVKYAWSFENYSIIAVETSPDDSTWTDVSGLNLEGTGSGTINLWGTVGFDVNKVRYVRFIISGPGGMTNTLKIYELVTI